MKARQADRYFTPETFGRSAASAAHGSKFLTPTKRRRDITIHDTTYMAAEPDLNIRLTINKKTFWDQFNLIAGVITARGDGRQWLIVKRERIGPDQYLTLCPAKVQEWEAP
jgi:hypothetical protein